jgi:hypothetical protein
MKHFSFKNPIQVLLKETANEPEVAIFYRDWNFKIFFPKDDNKTKLDILKSYSNSCKYLRDLNINLKIDAQLSMACKDRMNDTYTLLNERFLVNSTIYISNFSIDFRFTQDIDNLYGGYEIINVVETFDFYSKKIRKMLMQLSKEKELKHPIPYYIYHTITEHEGFINFMHSENSVLGNQVMIPDLQFHEEKESVLFKKQNF